MNRAIKDIFRTLFDYCKEKKFNHPHMIIAEEILRDEKSMLTNITIREIKLDVYRYFGLSEEYAESSTRKRECVKARQIAMALAHYISMENKLHWSLAAIGMEIGGKDHATVLHSVKVVCNMRETERHYNREYNEIELNIRSKFSKHETKEKEITSLQDENSKSTKSLC